MLLCDSGNPEIAVRNGAAFGSEAIFYSAKVQRGFLIARQYSDRINKMLKTSLIIRNPLSQKCAVVQFANYDGRKKNPPGFRLRFFDGRLTIEECNHDICIKQISTSHRGRTVHCPLQWRLSSPPNLREEWCRQT